MPCTVLGTQTQQRNREASSLPSQSLRSRGENSELSLFTELGGRQRRGVVDNLRGIVDKNRSKSINFVCIVACSCREAATADMIINFCSISAIYLIS